MYHTTGLLQDQILDLCSRAHSTPQKCRRNVATILGLTAPVVGTLTYLRRNRAKQNAETYDSRNPPSREPSRTHPDPQEHAHELSTPTTRSANPVHFVDGSLLPCWFMAGTPGAVLRQTQDHRPTRPTRLRLDGSLAWISDRSTDHAMTLVLKESGVLISMTRACGSATKATIGNEMLRRSEPAHEHFLDWEKDSNTQINKFGTSSNQTIANFKTWDRAYDYRRPLKSFPETISAVVLCTFYKRL